MLKTCLAWLRSALTSKPERKALGLLPNSRVLALKALLKEGVE